MRGRPWMLPFASAVVAVVAASALLRVDRYLARFGTAGVPEASLSVAVVVLLVSTGLVGLLAVVTALHRPAIDVLPPPSAEVTLSLLVAAIVTAIVGVGGTRLGIAGGTPSGPALTVTVGALLFLAALLAFVGYTRELARSADPYAAVARLGAIAAAAADAAYPPAVPADVAPAPRMQMARAVPAPRSGYVAGVDPRRLASAARAGNAVVFAPALGTFVTRGTPLLEIHSLDGRTVPSRITRGVTLADVRDPRIDAPFALALLSDIAVGSLESRPGVAEAALDRIGVVLSRVGARPFPTGRIADEGGIVRVVQPVVAWRRLVEIALADIAHRGAGDPRVQERVTALVDELSRRLPADRAAALAAYSPYALTCPPAAGTPVGYAPPAGAPASRRAAAPREQRIPVVDAEAPDGAGAPLVGTSSFE